MFKFDRKQEVFDLGGVKFGGQPGESVGAQIEPAGIALEIQHEFLALAREHLQGLGELGLDHEAPLVRGRLAAVCCTTT